MASRSLLRRIRLGPRIFLLQIAPALGLLALIALLTIPQVQQRQAADDFSRVLAMLPEQNEARALLQAEREVQWRLTATTGDVSGPDLSAAIDQTSGAFERLGTTVPATIDAARVAGAGGVPISLEMYDELIAKLIDDYADSLIETAPTDRLVRQSTSLGVLWRAEEVADIERRAVAAVSAGINSTDAARVAALHQRERNMLRQLERSAEGSIVAAARDASFESSWASAIDLRDSLLAGQSIDADAWLATSSARVGLFDAVIAQQEQELIDHASETLTRARRLMAASIFGCLIAAAAVVLSVMLLRASLLRPVRRLREAVADLISGRITVRAATGQDEMGELEAEMTTLNELFAHLEEEANTVQAALGSGDLGARYTGAYPGIWGRLVDGLNVTLDRMQGAVSREVEAEQRRAEAESVLSHNESHDPTTNLVNLSGLARWANSKRDSGSPPLWAISAVPINLDVIEAVHGLDFKHRALELLARRLENVVGSGSLLASAAASEFVVVGTFGGPSETADAIVGSTRRPLSVDGTSIDIRFAIGHARGMQDLPSLLAAAANAGRASRTQPLAASVAYIPEMQIEARKQMEIGSWLETVVERDEIEVWYQPIVDAETLTERHFEALVRGRNEGELVPPDSFIAIAETTGRIVEVGDRVRALSLAASSRLPVPNLSINLSPVELGNNQLPDRISEQLAQSGVKPEHVTIEVTESALIDGSAEVRTRLQAIRDLGVGLAIDDFGSGYSSFSYLRTLPLTVMKLDRTLIENLDQDESACAVVRRMIELAHDLGLRVVAEGVETEAELDVLRSMRCDLIQGWLVARALPLAEISQLSAAP